MVGVVLAVVAAFIFLGGVTRIAAVTEKLVPVMACFYLVGGLVMLIANITNLPHAFALIFEGAFNPQAILGGAVGIGVREAMRYGVARGLFSNEAGMGSTPHAHAMAKVEKPQDQGVVAMVCVFIDTFVVLTITALVMITSGALNVGNMAANPAAENMAQVAFSKIQEDRISKLFNAGKSPESDVVEAHSQVAQDEMGRTQAKCDYKLAMLDLSQLLELSSPDSIEIVAPQGETSPTLPPLPDRIFARAEGVKPEIQAEKLRLQAAEKNIRIAKAALYPTLSLGAGLSSEYYKTSGYQAASFSKQLSDNFNKSIGLSLNIPIFNRLATRNSIRQAKLQQSEQALQLDETKKTLYKEIQQAYYNAVNAQAKYESALAARKAAESNFNMMTGKFENGRANATELEEAKTKRANAITSTLQAKYEYILRMKIIEFYEGNKLG